MTSQSKKSVVGSGLKIVEIKNERQNTVIPEQQTERRQKKLQTNIVQSWMFEQNQQKY